MIERIKMDHKILIILLIVFTVITAYPSCVWADQEQKVINPLTGIETDPNWLSYPPFIIPYTKFPDKFRSSAGLSFAPWVFEMYSGDGESRPIALFYGSIPESTTGITPYIGSISSAVLGLESLRKQYMAVLITAGNPDLVKKAGISNLETWYGESGSEKYPDLPVQRFIEIMEKWKKRLGSPDIEGISLPFSAAIPEGSRSGKTLFIRYAVFNQILWEFDEADGLYHRSQNSVSDPNPVKDIDVLNNQQITAQNVILLFTDHSLIEDGVNFTVNFNYVKKNPALIFRDGLCYQAFWTTKAEEYEIQNQKLRPIRFLEADGDAFHLKPGKSWVHVVQINNPVYEIAEPTGNQTEDGSGHWKVPYISVKPNEKNLNPVP